MFTNCSSNITSFVWCSSDHHFYFLLICSLLSLWYPLVFCFLPDVHLFFWSSTALKRFTHSSGIHLFIWCLSVQLIICSSSLHPGFPVEGGGIQYNGSCPPLFRGQCPLKNFFSLPGLLSYLQLPNWWNILCHALLQDVFD